MNLETRSGELSFNSNQSKCQTVRLWSLQRNQWKSFELGKDTDILFLLFFFLSLNSSHACPLLGTEAVFLCKNIKKKQVSCFPFFLLFWDMLVYGLNKSTLSNEIIAEIIVFANYSSDEWITHNETYHGSAAMPCVLLRVVFWAEFPNQYCRRSGWNLPAAVLWGEQGGVPESPMEGTGELAVSLALLHTVLTAAFGSITL